MNERDERTVRAGSRLLVDQPDTASLQLAQCASDVLDFERDVMQAGTTLR
jgi:hypothetical protein